MKDSALKDSARVLVQGIQEGSAQAEDDLVARYGTGLKVMLYQLTRDPFLADDLYQETFALALTKIRQGEVREPEALAGFLRSVARNLFIADRRKEARYSRLDDEQQVVDRRVEDASPLRRTLAADEARRVRQLLAELRFPRDREVLMRYYLSDVSKEELCRDLGIEAAQFKMILFRARQRLRELWERSEKRQRLGREAHAMPAAVFLAALLAASAFGSWRTASRRGRGG